MDREILEQIARTKGTLSESERVNRLLRYALDLERRAALEQEAARFFAAAPAERRERRAFESATVESWNRE